jgi:hypothetical protein
MLVPYLRDTDTTNMLANYKTSINNKLDAKDTTLMLSNYLKKSEGLNESDPLFNGSIAKGITAIDTSNWNKKLSALDTSGMLANYRTSLNSKLNSSDTTKMLSVYLKNTDTIQMSNKIQELVTKVNNLDSNSTNFNNLIKFKSFLISNGENKIFNDTLLKDNEIWDFQIFINCNNIGNNIGNILATISFLDSLGIKLNDNSYFRTHTIVNGYQAPSPGQINEDPQLFPLSNLNNDLIYNNSWIWPNTCFNNRFLQGKLFWNLRKNSIIKLNTDFPNPTNGFNSGNIGNIIVTINILKH